MSLLDDLKEYFSYFIKYKYVCSLPASFILLIILLTTLVDVPPKHITEKPKSKIDIASMTELEFIDYVYNDYLKKWNVWVWYL